METVMIMTFSYEHSVDIQTLISASNDINSIVENSWSANRIFLLTDMEETSIEGVEHMHVHNLKDFYAAINNINMSTKSLVYYSGHGTSGGIKLPSNEYLSFREYRRATLSTFSNMSEIIWIVDCCHSGDFPLPYTLKSNRFHLDNMHNCSLHRIIGFVSSGGEEKSISNAQYSYFTKYLLSSMFNHQTRSLILIEERVRRKLSARTIQTPYVLSSSKMIPVLWPWLFSSFSRVTTDDDGIRVYS